MDNKVNRALVASLDKYASLSGQDSSAVKQSLIEVFSKEQGFLEKVEAFDAVFDESPSFEDIDQLIKGYATCPPSNLRLANHTTDCALLVRRLSSWTSNLLSTRK